MFGIFASNPLYCRASGAFDPDVLDAGQARDYLRNDIGMDGCSALLARIDRGRAVAYLSLPARHPKDGLPWVMELVVHGEMQGRGIGGRLTKHAEDTFRATGAGTARICVLEQTPPAREFWAALGWRAIRQGVPNENGRVVIVMEKSLTGA
ncbi:GNAT family N-acetyltransferase [Streptomyces sp. NPDC052701]|uniref:GNAT family N-acetyltransferase n=1 Tax=Streptomyces sp. NPDC052701 TaxID=3155533 RepID=UPI003425816F